MANCECHNQMVMFFLMFFWHLSTLKSNEIQVYRRLRISCSSILFNFWESEDRSGCALASHSSFRGPWFSKMLMDASGVFTKRLPNIIQIACAMDLTIHISIFWAVELLSIFSITGNLVILFVFISCPGMSRATGCLIPDFEKHAASWAQHVSACHGTSAFFTALSGSSSAGSRDLCGNRIRQLCLKNTQSHDWIKQPPFHGCKIWVCVIKLS